MKVKMLVRVKMLLLKVKMLMMKVKMLMMKVKTLMMKVKMLRTMHMGQIYIKAIQITSSSGVYNTSIS